MRTLAFGATVLALLGLASPARSESILPLSRSQHQARRLRDSAGSDSGPLSRGRPNWWLRMACWLIRANQPSQGRTPGHRDLWKPNARWCPGDHRARGRRRLARRARRGGLLRTLTTAIDTALVGSGRRPLSASDVAQLKRMLVEAAVALALTGLLPCWGRFW